MMQTRRQMMMRVAGAGVATALGISGRDVLGQTPEAVSIDSGWMGLSRGAWEAIAGPGTERGDLVEYPNPERDGSSILVRFDADRVDHMEIGFEGTELGGVPPEGARATVARTLPLDAEALEAFIVPGMNREQTRYRAERIATQQLEGGPLLVVYQERDVGFDTGTVETVVVRVTVTLPGPHTLIAEQTGDPGGIGLSRDEWEATHGEPEPAQGGDRYESVVVPGYQLLVQHTPGEDWVSFIDARAGKDHPDGLPYGEARPLALAAIPADALLGQTYDLPATPEGPIALWAEVWESDTVAELHGESGAVLVLFQRSGSGEPGVPRMSLTVPVMPG